MPGPGHSLVAARPVGSVGSAVVDREFWISELTDDDRPAVIALCRTALDLPEDVAEAAEIVRRLRDTTGTEGWSPGPRRLAAFVALPA